MQNRFIDLYSDTKTKPSPGMRKAMAEAEVGDEQKYEDPTVERLRERICELLGKEDAVFLPSGTKANQIAIRVHCRLGDEEIADRTAHIINAETGGPAANAGVMIRPIEGPNGIFTGEQVKAALRDPNSRNAPRSRLVSIENTSNGGFGTVMPRCTSTSTSGDTPAQRHQYQSSRTRSPLNSRSFHSRFCASSRVAPHPVELTI